MNNPGEMLIGVAGLVLAAAAAFATYRWRQRARAGRVGEWVRRYLVTRYGQMPGRLNIICTGDPLWPVLVAFERPEAQVRHTLQFSCASDESSFFLLREKEELCARAPTESGGTPAPAVRREAITEATVARD